MKSRAASVRGASLQRSPNARESRTPAVPANPLRMNRIGQLLKRSSPNCMSRLVAPEAERRWPRRVPKQLREKSTPSISCLRRSNCAGESSFVLQLTRMFLPLALPVALRDLVLPCLHSIRAAWQTHENSGSYCSA